MYDRLRNLITDKINRTIVPAMFCTECGKEVSNEFKFCPHCGFNLQQALSTINSKPVLQETTASENLELIQLAKEFGTIETKPNIYQNAKNRLREMGQTKGYTPIREYFFKETPQSLQRKIDIVWRSPNGFAAAFNIKSKNWRLERADDLEQISRLASFHAEKKYIVNVSKTNGNAYFIELTDNLVKALELEIKASPSRAYDGALRKAGYIRAYEGWSKEEDKQIMDEVRQGLTIDQIAEKHERQKGAIYSRLNKLVNEKETENTTTAENEQVKNESIQLEGQYTFLVKSEKHTGVCLACISESKQWMRPITAGGFTANDLIMDNGKQLSVFDVVETKFDCQFPILHHRENVKFALGTPLHYIRTLTESERLSVLSEMSNKTLLNYVNSKDQLFDELTSNLCKSLVLVGPIPLFHIEYSGLGKHHRIWFVRENNRLFSLSCTDLKFCRFIESKLGNTLLPEGIISCEDIEGLKNKAMYFVIGVTGDSLDVNNVIKDGRWHGKYWPLIVSFLTVPAYTTEE